MPGTHVKVRGCALAQSLLTAGLGVFHLVAFSKIALETKRAQIFFRVLASA